MQELIIWQCPECGHEIHQSLFGSMHTAGIACAECDVNMETMSKEQSDYEFEE